MLKTKIANTKSNALNIRVINNLPYKADTTEFSLRPVHDVFTEECIGWTDMPIIGESLAHEQNIDPEQFELSFRKEFADYLHNQQAILDLLALADMGKYGKGLFAFQDIPEGTVLGVYTGEILSLKDNTPSDYALGMLTHNTSSQHTIAARKDNLLAVDALNYGNLTRYMQHLVNKDNIEYHFTNDLKKIQTANVQLKVKLIANVPVFYLVASENIPKHSIIGFDYTLQYWKAKKQQPAFFTHNGEEISDCVPYKEWSPKVLNIATLVTEIFHALAKAEGKLNKEDLLLYWQAFTTATNVLIDEDKEIIEELKEFKIGNDLLMDVLKALISQLPVSLMQEDIQQKINLLGIPKTAAADLTPAIKILGRDSAVYALYKEIKPEIIGNLDHMRRQVFGQLSTDAEFKLHLKAMSSVEWKSKQSENRYTFWSIGDKKTMDKVDEILTEHHIEHRKGQIKGKDEYSVQIAKTF
ncbi:SET domain-containing protein-lysine N-methyltransferase [Legionella israelensis]|uniref:Eukaryotic huntingtin interacting protein B n=1 Tax=Legionella israelensis TaxID=454 RepID=A0A0W0WN78_9GAMM|nr:SET domain-containing protein-lysine N-methyltransferase [Legionella israelensis]KTD33770.1 eukaryotic huntingtin interacting protein B [Legionella israelensis]QBS09263.1 SET domain-containing protein [Legionella israelensis]SCY31693.1 hypothetical protein SAMN02746069_02006 [Legionella israelensis DSM 19235]STX59011.1 eukaryotic huntingtin interacting protein B [Legionella israelensis]